MGTLKESKRKLSCAFGKHRLDFLAGYKGLLSEDVSGIPKEKSLVPGSTQDFWQLVETEEEDTTQCIFTLGPRGVFPTHYHLHIREDCIILTENGVVEWVTERGISTHRQGEVFTAFPGEEHALISLVDFPIEILIKWSPKMLGWEAVFSEMKVQNTYLNK